MNKCDPVSWCELRKHPTLGKAVLFQSLYILSLPFPLLLTYTLANMQKDYWGNYKGELRHSLVGPGDKSMWLNLLGIDCNQFLQRPVQGCSRKAFSQLINGGLEGSRGRDKAVAAAQPQGSLLQASSSPRSASGSPFPLSSLSSSLAEMSKQYGMAKNT